MTPSDLSLLREFSDQQSESAFAALVQRHLDLVHSAATRLARNRQLAEEVAQAVFLALAQQSPRIARKVEGGMPLSAWLHLTTRNLAAKLIRSETRRIAREHASSTMQPASDSPSSSSSDWERIATHLDQGLGELSETDRRVILLRFFEGKTAREIAAQLGIAEEAAQKRVLRALDRLRTHLVQHASGLGAPALGMLLSTWAVQKAPTALAGSIANAAIQGLGSAMSSSIVDGIQRICAEAFMTKSQTIATSAVVAALALPIAYQATEIQDLRARSAVLPTVRLNAPDSPVMGLARVTPPVPGEILSAKTEAAEIARLRARAEELRKAISDRQSAPAPPPPRPATAGPLLLRPGQSVPVTNLVVAGADSPEAAAQTILVHMRDGNLEAALSLYLLSPTDRTEFESEVLHDPAARDALAQRMKSEVSAVRTVELTGLEPITQHRTRVALRRVTANETNDLKMVFGHTPSGWKQVQAE